MTGASIKRAARALMRRIGYDVVRIEPDDGPGRSPSHDRSRDLPPGTADDLRADHPRLLELRRRYAELDLPMARRTMWGGSYLEKELDLTRFRGDNAYIWQFRHFRRDTRRKFYMFLRDIASRDSHHLLDQLREDGLFGCWTFEYPGWPIVSRDLLDSINEIYFLERHTGLLSRPGFTVLDIGAGYGRLAHRALAAAPGLGGYLCADAVPESTFLCEYYLRFRGGDARGEVLPLHELDARLAGRRVDLAVNVHSFSEMDSGAITGWLQRVASLNAPWLLVVPNDADQLLTMEDDRTRRDFAPLIATADYELAVKEPVFADATLREFMGVNDHFFLFRKRGG